MPLLEQTLRQVANSTKRMPLLGALQFAAHDLYWRARSRREWHRRYVQAELVAQSVGSSEPSLGRITSQLCTASQCVESRFRRWCREMRSPPRLSRKQWEFVYVLEALEQAGMLGPGRRGLGFGCGGEPLPAVMAKRGASVIATDLAVERAAEQGWVQSREHAASLRGLNNFGICERRQFDQRVAFEFADMNRIPEKFAAAFDFTWSCCALEHLGSLRHGMEFVKNSMRCLQPGGVAVHTTEFNLSSNEDTLEAAGCSIYRRRDIEALRDELEALGYTVAPLNFHPGAQPVDHHIDVPPYSGSPHLKLRLDRYVATSIGLIVVAPLSAPPR